MRNFIFLIILTSFGILVYTHFKVYDVKVTKNKYLLPKLLKNSKFQTAEDAANLQANTQKTLAVPKKAKKDLLAKKKGRSISSAKSAADIIKKKWSKNMDMNKEDINELAGAMEKVLRSSEVLIDESPEAAEE